MVLGRQVRKSRGRKWSGHSHFLFGLVAFLGLSGGLAFPSAVSSMAEPGIKATTGLIAMLQARSPGERRNATVTTKPRHARAAAAGQAGTGIGGRDEPDESPRAGRLLPGMIAPQPVTGLDTGGAFPLLGSVPDELAAALAASSPSGISTGGFGQAGPGVVFAASPIGGGGAGGIGTPGNGGATSPPGSAEVPVVAISAVPEPSTWITMLLGFAAVGHALRRRVARASNEVKPLLAGGCRSGSVSPTCFNQLPV
jgi:hypothetical protein